MGKAYSFDATLTPKRGRSFPKKILRHKKIPITRTYTFTVSVWIADTPESNMKPTINLVIAHGTQKLRLCFNSVTEMLEAINSVRDFVLDNSFKVDEVYAEALREFLYYHEEKRLFTLNGNTISTVIQDISERKYGGKKTFLNTRTGEIIEP